MKRLIFAFLFFLMSTAAIGYEGKILGLKSWEDRVAVTLDASGGDFYGSSCQVNNQYITFNYDQYYFSLINGLDLSDPTIRMWIEMLIKEKEQKFNNDYSLLLAASLSGTKVKLFCTGNEIHQLELIE